MSKRWFLLSICINRWCKNYVHIFCLTFFTHAFDLSFSCLCLHELYCALSRFRLRTHSVNRQISHQQSIKIKWVAWQNINMTWTYLKTHLFMACQMSWKYKKWITINDNKYRQSVLIIPIVAALWGLIIMVSNCNHLTGFIMSKPNAKLYFAKYSDSTDLNCAPHT